MYPQEGIHCAVQVKLLRTWKLFVFIATSDNPPGYYSSTAELQIRKFFGTDYYIAVLLSLMTLKCQTCPLFANSLLHKSVYPCSISPQSHIGKTNANSVYFLPQMLFFHTWTQLNKSWVASGEFERSFQELCITPDVQIALICFPNKIILLGRVGFAQCVPATLK